MGRELGMVVHTVISALGRLRQQTLPDPDASLSDRARLFETNPEKITTKHTHTPSPPKNSAAARVVATHPTREMERAWKVQAPLHPGWTLPSGRRPGNVPKANNVLATTRTRPS